MYCFLKHDSLWRDDFAHQGSQTCSFLWAGALYCICPAVAKSFIHSSTLSGLNASSFRCFQVWQWKINTWIVPYICVPVFETLVYVWDVRESLYVPRVFFDHDVKLELPFYVLLVITVFCYSVIISCMHKIRLNCNLCNHRNISTEMSFSSFYFKISQNVIFRNLNRVKIFRTKSACF